jgi:N-methylhydantoinase A
MEKAIRVVSIERGYDPRDFTLVAFGGAGGLHACELAEALSIQRVMIPALPGALSAFGILVSDVVKDYSRTEFAALRRRAEADFHLEEWRGTVTHQRSADVRYHGQGYELNIPYTPNLIRDFRREHQRRYGYSYPARDMELVTLRLRSLIKSPQARIATDTTPTHVGTTAPVRPGRSRLGALLHHRAPVIFAGKKITAAIHSRDSLKIGNEYRGPAIVTEYSATTVLPPGTHFWRDRRGSLLIERG